MCLGWCWCKSVFNLAAAAVPSCRVGCQRSAAPSLRQYIDPITSGDAALENLEAAEGMEQGEMAGLTSELPGERDFSSAGSHVAQEDLRRSLGV